MAGKSFNLYPVKSESSFAFHTSLMMFLYQNFVIHLAFQNAVSVSVHIFYLFSVFDLTWQAGSLTCFFRIYPTHNSKTTTSTVLLCIYVSFTINYLHPYSYKQYNHCVWFIFLIPILRHRGNEWIYFC